MVPLLMRAAGKPGEDGVMTTSAKAFHPHSYWSRTREFLIQNRILREIQLDKRISHRKRSQITKTFHK